MSNCKPERNNDKNMLPILDQRGDVVAGPGAIKEAPLRGIGLRKLSSKQQDRIKDAKKYAMQQSVKFQMTKQQAKHQQQKLVNVRDSIQRQQALTMMCTLYVGSIAFDLREENVKTAFSPFGPVRSVNMSRDTTTGLHKGYAFLEFEVPEAATLAEEQMNGVLMGGRNLRVGRPSNMPQAQHIVENILAEAKRYPRIYVSSIHPDLGEEDVRGVFEAFGPIKTCQLAKGSPLYNQKHKGFGYIEFDSETAAVEAIAAMNLFDLGGQYLRVGRAVTPPLEVLCTLTSATANTMPSAAARAAAEVAAKLQALEAENARKAGPPVPKVVVADSVNFANHSGNSIASNGSAGATTVLPPPGVAIPQVPPAPMPPSLAPCPPPAPPQLSNHILSGSNTVCLRNLVNSEDIDDSLQGEIEKECSSYGSVSGVTIDAAGSNKTATIYVKFSSPQEALVAQKSLQGRYFNGRTIVAELVNR